MFKPIDPLPQHNYSRQSLGVRAILTVAISIVLSGCGSAANNGAPSNIDTSSGGGSSPAGSVNFGVQTKSSNCVANQTYPDRGCTPGAIFPNVTAQDICVSGYSSRVRSVSTEEKKQVYAEYDIVSRASGEYEVDHYVSLELGGSNDIANLWPELASPKPGFHEKDQVENYLHGEVCSGALSLHDAQVQVATDWVAVYHRMIGG